MSRILITGSAQGSAATPPPPCSMTATRSSSTPAATSGPLHRCRAWLGAGGRLRARVGDEPHASAAGLTNRRQQQVARPASRPREIG